MTPEDLKLLHKYLDGHCTGAERQKVKELLQQPDAQQIMQALAVQEWEEPAATEPGILVIMDDWKQKIHARIAQAENKTKESVQILTPVRKLPLLRYAAIWVGLLLLGTTAFWQLKNTQSRKTIAYIEKTNTQGQPVKYWLPDSSEVYLGAGSRLSYPADFAGDIRKIDLSGEAFFQVRPDASKPFIIYTGEIQTRVMGTSFKIQAFKDQPLVVAVASGKVGVSRVTGEQQKPLALLTAGSRITWNDSTGKAIQDRVDIYSLEQWTSGDMLFADQTIEQITTELQRRYPVKIDIIDKQVAGNQASGTFPAAKPIEKIMKALAIAGKFRYETSDNKYFRIYRTE